jgi:DNA-binding beta-propeller fold protein YncE
MRPLALAVAVVLAVLLIVAYGGRTTGQSAIVAGATLPAEQAPRAASGGSASTQHYEYVFPDGAMYVYDIDHALRLVQRVNLPATSDGIRGAVASPATHMLYISHGGDGGGAGNGSLLAYDLVSQRVVWDKHYGRGIDSMAISPSGARIYMPDGELSGDGIWSVIDARSGQVIGEISGGTGPHNTIVGLSGKRVYLGGRNSPYLDVASTATNQVVKRVGPLASGVRPFTINGRETIAYTTATGFLGFQVSSLVTGRVLYTVTFGSRFRWDPANFGPSAPSHGISLSADERQLWVIDAPNGYVHVFDVSGVPQRAPRRIADIKLSHPLTGDESGCSYDCPRDGWIQHSRSGCFVFVGDSGDVLSASGFRPVAFLPPLRDTRKHIEIDWRAGRPVATTSRSGLGYVTHGRRPRPPACR